MTTGEFEQRTSCMQQQLPDPLNPLQGKPTKWSNLLKQFDSKLPTKCLGVFDHFVGLALKGLREL